MRSLIAIPVYNEEKALGKVLLRTIAQAEAAGADVLIVDDGSTDGTDEVIARYPSVKLFRHDVNRGYGAALISAFRFAIDGGYDAVLTMDSDGQHEPGLIPEFLSALGHGRASSEGFDIVSGSRYLGHFNVDTAAPPERRRINALVTDELNASLHLNITDAFCGFKAYRVSALSRVELTEPGYGMPLELWVEASCKNLRLKEMAVPRVYLDANRSFGSTLDDGQSRLAYYQHVIDRAYTRARVRHGCGMAGSRAPRFQPAT